MHNNRKHLQWALSFETSLSPSLSLGPCARKATTTVYIESGCARAHIARDRYRCIYIQPKGIYLVKRRITPALLVRAYIANTIEQQQQQQRLSIEYRLYLREFHKLGKSRRRRISARKIDFPSLYIYIYARQRDSERLFSMRMRAFFSSSRLYTYTWRNIKFLVNYRDRVEVDGIIENRSHREDCYTDYIYTSI